MSTIVLVPGAGLGGWAFTRLTPLLRAAGHDVHPLTLTGTGDRAHLNRPDLDVSAWATDVVAHLETEELEDVVLVGHSFGGAVTTAAAERCAARLAALVYLEGVVPVDGASAFDAMGPQFAEAITALVDAHDGWSLPWFTDEQLDMYYGDHALSADDLRWMRRHLTAQPLATFREPVRAQAAAVLPRTYVSCTGTPGGPLVPEGTPGWKHAELATGHWPMVTAPDATAALLGELAAVEA